MTAKIDPALVQAKLAKAGSSLAIHAARGKKLEGNVRSERMMRKFDELRKEAVKAGAWKAYCQAAKLPPTIRGRDFFR